MSLTWDAALGGRIRALVSHWAPVLNMTICLLAETSRRAQPSPPFVDVATGWRATSYRRAGLGWAELSLAMQLRNRSPWSPTGYHVSAVVRNTRAIVVKPGTMWTSLLGLPLHPHRPRHWESLNPKVYERVLGYAELTSPFVDS